MKRDEMRGRDMELERLRMREEAEARRRLERLLEAARRPIRDLPVHGVGLLTVGPNGEHFVRSSNRNERAGEATPARQMTGAPCLSATAPERLEDTMKYYEIDIDQARIAHEANSLRPFDGAFVELGYRDEVDEAYSMADEQAERHPHAADRARELADRFAAAYARWINEGFRIEAMCPSVLVCGAGNFPTARKERQNARRDAHMKELGRVMEIKRRIGKVGTGGVQCGDADALERLRAKAALLEERHERMKRANAHYRRHGTLRGFEDGLEGLEPCFGFEADGREVPFPGWALSNSRASIRRTRERIERIEREKAAPGCEREAEVNGEACRVVENAGLMRLQIVFDVKPGDETREMLKRSGFRWSPKNGAWQRQLTDNARRALGGLEG